MAYKPPAIVAEVVKRWDAEKKHHDPFVRKYEEAERAYRGVMNVASDAARWRHHYAPKYAYNLIETIISSTSEMGLTFDVHPIPHPGAQLPEAMAQLAQADAVGDLLRHEQRIDDMDDKQRPLLLSTALCGRGIGKSYWNYRTGPVTKQTVTLKDIHDPFGNVVMQVPVIEKSKIIDVVQDHSTTEIIDPRDFVVHQSATELQPWKPGGAQYLFHRCYYSFEQLKMLERSGFVSNVDELRGEDRGLDFEGYDAREREMWNTNRTKDMVEVLEYWKFADGVVKRCLVGNRLILLRDLEDSPYDHGGYPFFMCSPMRHPFSMQGMSDMELIASLQEMLWEITNQRLDNVELINNWITLIRSDVDDPEAFEFYPGARWPVESADDVSTLQPPYQLLEGTIAVEGQIRTDLQNVTGATPFAGGTELASAGATGTATGASLVMNAAQQRMAYKKRRSQLGLVEDANMRLKNCQQFITEPRLVHILGMDGARTFREIEPAQLIGEFVAQLDPSSDSELRQEKRAEATQFAQVIMSFVPAAAASGTPMNVKEITTWLAKKWDIEDADRFFSQNPAALGAAGQPGPGGQQGAPTGGPEGPNLGITAGSAMDASSPSASGGLSMSPVIALQRALAIGGGGKGGAGNS